MKAPTIYKLRELQNLCNTDTMASFNSPATGVQVWVPARPEGLYSIGNRIKAAWLVFTGKADAVIWPGDQ